MTNVEMLQQKIDASGKGPVVLAAEWGVSLPTYYKLKAGESEFTASTLVRATVSLKLTRDERDLIFLADCVSDNHE
jgi:hypothetical protein